MTYNPKVIAFANRTTMWSVINGYMGPCTYLAKDNSMVPDTLSFTKFTLDLDGSFVTEDQPSLSRTHVLSVVTRELNNAS